MPAIKKPISNKRDGLLFAPLLAVAGLLFYLNNKADLTPAIPSPILAVYESRSPPCDPNIVYRGPAGLPALRWRGELGRFLTARNLTDGAEVGVQSGAYAEQMLQRWKTCKSYSLIDVWAQLTNYEDGANVDNDKQQSLFEQTQKRLEPFKDKAKYYRMLSTEAAKQIPDNSLDYIYIDARHDYCGVKEDLEAYWPKMRPGAIIAGHDFLNHFEVKAISPQQDWRVCQDGTTNLGAVRGAVEEFAEQHGLVLSTTYRDGNWISWITQKPTRMECVKDVGAWNLPM
jgi:Methyltransferase domain